MKNHINYLEINNFKSIRRLELSGFNKINLFIGRPNVGKSNLLEALSLFSLPYLNVITGKLDLNKTKHLIRVEEETELFYEGDFMKNITVTANDKKCEIFYNTKELLEKGFYVIFTILLPKQESRKLYKEDSHIKRYIFNSLTKFRKNGKYNFLSLPFGENIVQSIELLPDVKETFAQWFRMYGLKLVIDKASQSLKILREINENEVFIIPYHSIADTLQRIIFYKTAIASNENSVLIFEEPEAHSYPPYIAEFTQEVINSATNQFFMATHSPIIVNDFLENAREDLAIFMVDFKDGQTTVKGLTKDEIYEVYKYGVDLFFNNEAYLA